MVSNMTEYIYAAIGVVLLLGVLFEAYRYLKGHPQALASLEAKVKAAEVKAQGLSGDVVAAIHAKLDSISTKVDATHAAALAPVTVTVVPATPIPTPPPAAVVQVAPTIVPTGQPSAPPPAPAQSPATDPARNGSDLGWTNGEWLWCSVADKVFTVSPPPGYTGYFQVHSGNAFGSTPTSVIYTVGGVTRTFGPNFQQWDTNAPDFPKAVLSGPFTVTVHQEGSPGNLQLSINHS